MMPILVGLNQGEMDRCKELFRYYNDMNIVRGIPFPVENIDKFSRNESLEYYNKMEDTLGIYQNILGKGITHVSPKDK
jgi:hypothetical protein